MLNKMHQARWNAAKKFYQSIIDCARTQNAIILWRDSPISPEQICITEDGVHIRWANTAVIMFEPDPDWDHGLHTPIKEYQQEIRPQFKLAKLIDF